jgi:O-antigen ligase
LKTLRNTVFHRFSLIDQPDYHWLISLLRISLLALPFGFMTFKGLFAAASAFSLIFSILALIIKSEAPNSFFSEKYFGLIIIYMLATPAAILLTQIIRGHISLRDFDGPIRLLVALPILIAIYKHRINFPKLLSLSIPLALLGIFIFAKFSPHPYGDRFTNHYLDPIFWGNFSIILGFMSFASIEPKDHPSIKAFKISGLALGLSMSLLSQSRAGWIAAIVMTLAWLALNKKELTLKKIGLYIFLLVFTLLILYFFLDTFRLRVDTAISEIFQWNSHSQTTSSSGIRLNMWKMTIHLFSLSPWIGYGEYSIVPIANDTYISSFADPESIRTIQCCGPHNEIAAQALRSGIFGIIALLATYFIPIYVFLKTKNHQSRLMGITLCIGLFICGFGTEMLSLKISYTLYAILISGLIATSLWKNNISHEQK